MKTCALTVQRLGTMLALAGNPIAQSGVATALEFSTEKPFVTRYRIEASAL
ncbi:hypothetical protein [Mesorhizobium sp. M0047]|uniref:hypothetical protein n=1 Tax=unclassified Mesorhizobium TaxID=325217 RepID=UPI0033376909